MLRMLFSGKQPKKDLSPKGGNAPAERAEIPYDPGLTAALTHQHRTLVALLIKARSAAQEQCYQEVGDALKQFKNGLDDHLDHESSGLHPYLAAHLKGA